MVRITEQVVLSESLKARSPNGTDLFSALKEAKIFVCFFAVEAKKQTKIFYIKLFFLKKKTFPDEEETDVTEFDLGTKIKTPKEVMLEELSLMKGKGSKMFKMRQQRVDKFIISAENLVSLLKRRETL